MLLSYLGLPFCHTCSIEYIFKSFDLVLNNYVQLFIKPVVSFMSKTGAVLFGTSVLDWNIYCTIL